MTDKLNKNIKLEDKLFTPVSKEMLEELSLNDIPSLIKFMYKTKKSYSQIHKIRDYLVAKEIAMVDKEGKGAKTTLTPKGREIAKSFMNFLEVLRKYDK